MGRSSFESLSTVKIFILGGIEPFIGGPVKFMFAYPLAWGNLIPLAIDLKGEHT
jgi:hypothetical protein